MSRDHMVFTMHRVSEDRGVLRPFGMTASLGTKKSKPQLTETHWHQIKRGKKKKKNKDTKSTYNIIKLSVGKPWSFGCWRMPRKPSRRPTGRRGWLSTAQPRTATPPQTHGWLWSRCQGARRWWRWRKRWFCWQQKMMPNSSLWGRNFSESWKFLSWKKKV